MPGSASGAGGGAATLGLDSSSQLTPLTVDFHEPGFVGMLNGETAFRQEKGFWFQLSDEDKQKANSPWGPTNPQALNRYSYVLNNPLRYVDPSGHLGVSIDPYHGTFTVHFTHQEVQELNLIVGLGGGAAGVWNWLTSKFPQFAKFLISGSITGDVSAALFIIVTGLWLADLYYGEQGVNVTITTTGQASIGAPTVTRQQGLWIRRFDHPSGLTYSQCLLKDGCDPEAHLYWERDCKDIENVACTLGPPEWKDPGVPPRVK